MSRNAPQPFSHNVGSSVPFSVAKYLTILTTNPPVFLILFFFLPYPLSSLYLVPHTVSAYSFSSFLPLLIFFFFIHFHPCSPFFYRESSSYPFLTHSYPSIFLSILHRIVAFPLPHIPVVSLLLIIFPPHSSISSPRIPLLSPPSLTLTFISLHSVTSVASYIAFTPLPFCTKGILFTPVFRSAF